MRRYLEILRSPHIGAMFATSLLARLPIGINGLAIVLLVRAETGSFAIAGAAAGALALGTGLAAPFAARLVDGVGRGVMPLLALVHAAGLAGIVALAGPDAHAAPLVVCAAVAGAAFPPASSVVRAQYPVLLGDRPHLLQSAFALDSVLTEGIFTIGPLLTAALVALVAPESALLVSAVAVLAGTTALVAVLPPAEPRTEGRSGGRLGALAAPGIRTLVVTMFPVGFAFGALEVAIPAFADAEGRPELAGVLIAIWSVSSLAGGLAYGAMPRRASLARVHLQVALLLPLSFLPMALAVSPATMALLVVPAGVFIAPMIATRNELAGRVALAGTETEAYTWPLTALVGGIAFGAAASGALSDTTSWQVAVVAAAGAAAVGALLATARRATLAPAT
ncbi:MAG: MFS transporter [Solirubrobacteraceae bacterium]